MRDYFIKKENGYTSSIQKGLSAVRSFRSGLSYGTGSREENIARLKQELETADTVVIGAGAGLSTSAGLTYSGERFEKYFFDFIERFGIPDMYSGGFYPYRSLEEFWAWWSRHIWVNRYEPIPKETYAELFRIVKDKDYFVLTTNVDHCFQRAGFDKHRLFYTQGDYGLWQCCRPCHVKTYDNEETVRQMLLSQGFVIGNNNSLSLPEGVTPKMEVPSELVPRCPVCGRPMTTNLRSDGSFVEDEGWRQANDRYREFLRRHEGMKILYWEIGVGQNTPVIIKYPFWRMTAKNPQAVYACMSHGHAYAPREIEKRAICIEGDADAIMNQLR